MSGSSHAGRALSRCHLSLDAGISISWAPDPDGSIEHGMRHHRDEEAQFLAQLDAVTPAVEVMFDELENAGRTFFPPSDAQFWSKAQRHSEGMPILELCVWAEPKFTPAELKALVERVANLLAVTT